MIIGAGGAGGGGVVVVVAAVVWGWCLGSDFKWHLQVNIGTTTAIFDAFVRRMYITTWLSWTMLA